MWMAGGGVKRGNHLRRPPTNSACTPSRTASRITISTPTILHLLGLDHERLTYRHNSRDFRLTDVYGNVVHDIIA